MDKEKRLYAEDLMLNDLVLMRKTAGDESEYPFSPGRVQICHFKEIDEGHIEAKAIPLTDEILEKNGFTKERDWGGTFKIKDGLDLIYAGMFSLHSYEFCGDDGGMNSACTGIYVDYVHELEHVLKQCEIEKNIVI